MARDFLPHRSPSASRRGTQSPQLRGVASACGTAHVGSARCGYSSPNHHVLLHKQTGIAGLRPPRKVLRYETLFRRQFYF